MYGPLEYVVIQFAGNGSISEILPALVDLEQRRCVQLVDLVFISKDEAGELSLLEISVLEKEDVEDDVEVYELISEFHGLLSEEDVAAAAVALPENTSAAVMLFEHLWAVGLQQSILAAGGQLLDSGYIHPDTQAEVIAEVLEMEEPDAA